MQSLYPLLQEHLQIRHFDRASGIWSWATFVIMLVSISILFTACGPNNSYVILVTATPDGANSSALGGDQSGSLPTPLFEHAPVGTSDPQIVPTPTFIPTPNPTRGSFSNPTEDVLHVVRFGDTLGVLASYYGVTVESIVSANNLPNQNFLVVGETLVIPTSIQNYGIPFKILPDSEIVYGPSAQGFDVSMALAGSGSFLERYAEELNGELMTGPQIVERVALEQSLNPRLLLTLLEYESAWISLGSVSEDAALYPLNYRERPLEIYGLYRQLDWAGKMIQTGYYGWRQRGLSATILADGSRAGLAPTLNAGTAGVQVMLAQTRTYEEWLVATGHTGLFATYNQLFGNPFARAVEPLVPAGLTQPEMSLPWAKNETWYFTGGPHGGWGAGSSWAALDFVPSSRVLGCELSEQYATAVADGIIARSEFGIVVLDLDGDGFEGTGWTVFYLHLATEGRQVTAGQRVNVGDPIGLPSCEGGVSFSSHLHIARRYNGEWIAVDCTECFLDAPAPQWVMDGWHAFTYNSEYDGYMILGEGYREACVCRESFNTFNPWDRP